MELKRCMVIESLWNKYDVSHKSLELVVKRFSKVYWRRGHVINNNNNIISIIIIVVSDSKDSEKNVSFYTRKYVALDYNVTFRHFFAWYEWKLCSIHHRFSFFLFSRCF